ncbi:MAG: guanylate kinase [Dehalococcoidia bacterium]|nr:guanylate kinase [Dehalococcoidia bacterium]
MSEPPLLLLISGPSGVGKDSVLAALRERRPDAHYTVTATTRPPRDGERNGVDYYFYSEADFLSLREEGAFLEHASVYGRYYGVPKAPIAAALAEGRDVLMRVDVQGAATIRALVPEVITVFLRTDSFDELEARLRARNSDDEPDLQRRITTARAEMDRLPEFDYAVANREGRLDETVDALLAIMRAERCRVGRAAPAIP